MQNLNLKKTLSSFILFLFIIGLSETGFSQNDFWVRTNGPLGGGVFSMVANDNNGDVYAGSAKGVYRSADDGDSWTRVGLSGGIIFGLEINASGRVFAGTSSGVSYSPDDGVNWVPMGFFPIPIIRAIGFKSTSSSIVYAGGNGGRIFRSSNNGDDWSEVHDGTFFSADVEGLVVDDSSHVFAGTFGAGGIWKSTDAGTTWVLSNTGLYSTGVVSLILDPASSTMVAGTNGTVYTSTDFGQNWNEKPLPVSTTVYDLELSGAGSLFAATSHGVFKSLNFGSTWTEENTGLTSTILRSFAVNENTGHLFAGSLHEGVDKSTNNGFSWARTGIPYPVVFDLAVNSNQDLFAGTNDTLFKTTDAGQNWVRSNNGLNDFRIQDIVFDDANGNTYAGTWSGVFRSNDGGATWMEINNGLTNTIVNSLSLNADGYVFAGTNGGVFRWDETNTMWVEVNNGLLNTFIQAIETNNANGDLYAGTLSEGVFKSTDNGDNWVAMNGGWMFFPQVISFAIDPAQDFIYAGTSGDGIYRAPLSGGNWVDVNAGIPGEFFIWVNALQVVAPGYLMAGISDEGVYQSQDDGQSWTELNSGLLSLDIRSFAIDSMGTVYAGSNGSSGVYRGEIVVGTGSAVQEARFAIESVFPNPFRQSTKILFSLGQSGPVNLEIFNSLGEKVSSLVSGWLESGSHIIEWKAEGISSGIYYCKIQIEGHMVTSKLVLINKDL